MPWRYCLVFLFLLSCTKLSNKINEIQILSDSDCAVAERITLAAQNHYPDRKVILRCVGNSKSPTGDLFLSSDISGLFDRKKKGQLASYLSAKTLEVPTSFKDVDGYFTAITLDTLVILSSKNHAKTWQGLVSSGLKGKISLPDPRTSQKGFHFIAQLSKHKGWSFVEQLIKQASFFNTTEELVGSLAHGTEIAVLSHQVALRLISQEKNWSISYPNDGTILVPLFASVLSSTENRSAAQEIYDYLLSSEMQSVMVSEGLYSTFVGFKPPQGARALKLLLALSLPLRVDLWERTVPFEREAILNQFSTLISSVQSRKG